MFAFMLAAHGFDNYFVVRFEIRKCESYRVALFLKIVLAIQGPLRFLMNFIMGFSISAKKGYWDFDRDCIDSVDHFG